MKIRPWLVSAIALVSPTAAQADNRHLSAGYYHTVVLKPDGSVWTWGLNSSYQLGEPPATYRLVPGQVPAESNVVSVAAGANFVLALHLDGVVWGWGSASAGETGPTSGGPTGQHVVIPLSQGAVAIGAGLYHSVALLSDGTVWSWGTNTYGLGDGVTTYSRPAVQVSGLTNVVSVGTGYSHTLAVKSDGTVWAWGYTRIAGRSRHRQHHKRHREWSPSAHVG